MKKKLLNLLLIILLLVAIPGTLLLASDISGALYKMSITVSNNGTLVNYVSTNGVISTPNLIAGGFLNGSANNCAVLDAADNDVPFMPGYTTNPWAFWVETIGADSYINYDLYTADTTGGTIAYFPALTGMIVADNATLELGNNFEINTSGWVDTTISANASLVYKEDAFEVFTGVVAGEITASIPNEGPFPTVAAVNGGNNPANVTNHTVNLPAGIVSGNLLLAFFVADSNPVIAFPGGWTQLFQSASAGNEVILGAFYRIADGTEGGTINVTTTTGQYTAHTTYRITGYSGVPESGAATNAADDSPDPPNLNPTWGVVNTLWFAVEGSNSTPVVNAYPANYGNGRNDTAAGLDGCGVGNARRERKIAAENPGVFTLSAGTWWVANTIAVAPTDLTVTATGVSSGEYRVKTTADGTDLKIYINDVEEDSAAMGGASVFDSGNDWWFFLNGAMPYMLSANIVVAGNSSAWAWEYDTIFYDSIGVNDATPSFRTASSDVDVVATAVSFQPITEAKAPAWTLAEETATWYTAANISGNFTTTPSPTYPGASVIEDIAAASGTPAQLPFVMVFGFITLAISLSVSYVMRQHGSRSIFVKIIIVGMLFIVGVALGLVDFWMMLLFLIIALAVMAASKPGSVI